MTDKRFVESFLRLNNVGADAPTAEIKKVLAQAHWPPEEIEEALLVRSGGTAAAQALAHRPHEQIFRPDMDWSSSKLSSLLGVDVIIDPKTFRMPASEQLKNTGKKVLFGFCVAVVAIIIAATLGVGLMYLFEIGPFYAHRVDII